MQKLILFQTLIYKTSKYLAYDTQILAALYLHLGTVVNMKTGEGKTLASVLALLLHSSKQNGLHMLTTSDYLAQRDRNWLISLSSWMKSSVGLITSSTALNKRLKEYFNDITYLNNTELGFDYLRDSRVINYGKRIQRPFFFGLVDEIDSILIDSAVTPLILSTTSNESVSRLNWFLILDELVKFLKFQEDFLLDYNLNLVYLTQKGVLLIKMLLNIDSTKNTKQTLIKIDNWIQVLLNILKARIFYRNQRDYILINKTIYIVDSLTGRILPGRRWNNGLHQAVESKECVPVNPDFSTLASITYQNLYNLYPILAGMTGTTDATRNEFLSIFALSIKQVPTFKPSFRETLNTVITQTELDKWRLVSINSRSSSLEKGLPLLIVTSSIDKSELLSELYLYNKIPHQLVNAKPDYAKEEENIVCMAGRKHCITLSTRMLSRGVDILIGGNILYNNVRLVDLLNCSSNHIQNPIFFANFLQNNSRLFLKENCIKALSLKEAYNYYGSNFNEVKGNWLFLNYGKAGLGFLPLLLQLNETNWILQNSGLFVINTEKSSTPRVDAQIAGRCGRQGNPGKTQLYVSLDDLFFKQVNKKVLKKLGFYNLFGQNWLKSNIEVEKTIINPIQIYVTSLNYESRKQRSLWKLVANQLYKAMQKMRNDLWTYRAVDVFILKQLLVCYTRKNKTKKAFGEKTTFDPVSPNNCFSLLDRWIYYVVYKWILLSWVTTSFYYQQEIRFLLEYLDNQWNIYIYFYDTFIENLFLQQWQNKSLFFIVTNFIQRQLFYIKSSYTKNFVMYVENMFL